MYRKVNKIFEIPLYFEKKSDPTPNSAWKKTRNVATITIDAAAEIFLGSKHKRCLVINFKHILMAKRGFEIDFLKSVCQVYMLDPNFPKHDLIIDN